MPTLPTSDLTRILDAIRRRWWLVAIAAAVGLLLGLTWSMSARPVSYASMIATPPLPSVDVIQATTTSTSAQPQLEEIISTLGYDATRAALGPAVEGASVSASPSAERTSMTVVVSAATDARAKEAATAYAAEAARLYGQRRKEMLSLAIESLEAGIATLREPLAPDAGGAAEAKLAELVVRKQMLEKLADHPPQPTQVSKVASSGTRTMAMATLALLFGGAAAGILGLRALSDPRLRYRDDVEEVVGSDALLGHVHGPGDVAAVRAMMERLQSHGGVRVVAIGGKQVDLAALGLPENPDPTTPQVLLVDLGTDTKATLDLAHRTATAGRSEVLGVLAVDRAAALLRQPEG